MSSYSRVCYSRGHTLIELLVVLGLLGVMASVGIICLVGGVQSQRARGAAQAWQAAAAWAQVGVLWHAGSASVACADGETEVAHEYHLCGGHLGMAAPAAALDTNVPRWSSGTGVRVSFGGYIASPDSGGSLYFGDAGRRYRVVVRPESGLTARTAATVVP
jgi:prepilin-type N-terminal cleavage/methylation domain-containing protein